MDRWLTRALVLLGTWSVACSSEANRAAPAGDAPHFGELFDQYFAAGTAGHCATSGCHADPGHTVWHCGPSAAQCYQGMVEVGLIDPAEPSQSSLIDEHRSPLTWINPNGGNMPLDAQLTNDSGAAAIQAWVAAGALAD